MNKNDFAQINGVAVTAFVLCLARRGLARRNDAPTCTDNSCRIARPVPAVRNQGGAAMGEGRAPAPGPLCRSARAGNISHHSRRGDAQSVRGPTRFAWPT